MTKQRSEIVRLEELGAEKLPEQVNESVAEIRVTLSKGGLSLGGDVHLEEVQLPAPSRKTISKAVGLGIGLGIGIAAAGGSIVDVVESLFH